MVFVSVDNINIKSEDIIYLINYMIEHFNIEHKPKYPIKINNIDCVIGLNKTDYNGEEDEWPAVKLTFTKNKIVEEITISNRRIITLKGTIKTGDEIEEYKRNSKIYCLCTILRMCGLVRFENNKYNDCQCVNNRCFKNFQSNNDENNIECIECFKLKNGLDKVEENEYGIYCGNITNKCLISSKIQKEIKKTNLKDRKIFFDSVKNDKNFIEESKKLYKTNKKIDKTIYLF